MDNALENAREQEPFRGVEYIDTQLEGEGIPIIDSQLGVELPSTPVPVEPVPPEPVPAEPVTEQPSVQPEPAPTAPVPPESALPVPEPVEPQDTVSVPGEPTKEPTSEPTNVETLPPLSGTFRLNEAPSARTFKVNREPAPDTQVDETLRRLIRVETGVTPPQPTESFTAPAPVGTEPVKLTAELNVPDITRQPASQPIPNLEQIELDSARRSVRRMLEQGIRADTKDTMRAELHQRALDSAMAARPLEFNPLSIYQLAVSALTAIPATVSDIGLRVAARNLGAAGASFDNSISRAYFLDQALNKIEAEEALKLLEAGYYIGDNGVLVPPEDFTKWVTSSDEYNRFFGDLEADEYIPRTAKARVSLERLIALGQPGLYSESDSGNPLLNFSNSLGFLTPNLNANYLSWTGSQTYFQYDRQVSEEVQNVQYNRFFTFKLPDWNRPDIFFNRISTGGVDFGETLQGVGWTVGNFVLEIANNPLDAIDFGLDSVRNAVRVGFADEIAGFFKPVKELNEGKLVASADELEQLAAQGRELASRIIPAYTRFPINLDPSRIADLLDSTAGRLDDEARKARLNTPTPPATAPTPTASAATPANAANVATQPGTTPGTLPVGNVANMTDVEIIDEMDDLISATTTWHPTFSQDAVLRNNELRAELTKRARAYQDRTEAVVYIEALEAIESKNPIQLSRYNELSVERDALKEARQTQTPTPPASVAAQPATTAADYSTAALQFDNVDEAWNLAPGNTVPTPPVATPANATPPLPISQWVRSPVDPFDFAAEESNKLLVDIFAGAPTVQNVLTGTPVNQKQIAGRVATIDSEYAAIFADNTQTQSLFNTPSREDLVPEVDRFYASIFNDKDRFPDQGAEQTRLQTYIDNIVRQVDEEVSLTVSTEQSVAGIVDDIVDDPELVAARQETARLRSILEQDDARLQAFADRADARKREAFANVEQITNEIEDATAASMSEVAGKLSPLRTPPTEVVAVTPKLPGFVPKGLLTEAEENLASTLSAAIAQVPAPLQPLFDAINTLDSPTLHESVLALDEVKSQLDANLAAIQEFADSVAWVTLEATVRDAATLGEDAVVDAVVRLVNSLSTEPETLLDEVLSGIAKEYSTIDLPEGQRIPFIQSIIDRMVAAGANTIEVIEGVKEGIYNLSAVVNTYERRMLELLEKAKQAALLDPTPQGFARLVAMENQLGTFAELTQSSVEEYFRKSYRYFNPMNPDAPVLPPSFITPSGRIDPTEWIRQQLGTEGLVPVKPKKVVTPPETPGIAEFNLSQHRDLFAKIKKTTAKSGSTFLPVTSSTPGSAQEARETIAEAISTRLRQAADYFNSPFGGRTRATRMLKDAAGYLGVKRYSTLNYHQLTELLTGLRDRLNPVSNIVDITDANVTSSLRGQAEAVVAHARNNQIVPTQQAMLQNIASELTGSQMPVEQAALEVYSRAALWLNTTAADTTVAKIDEALRAFGLKVPTKFTKQNKLEALQAALQQFTTPDSTTLYIPSKVGMNLDEVLQAQGELVAYSDYELAKLAAEGHMTLRGARYPTEVGVIAIDNSSGTARQVTPNKFAVEPTATVTDFSTTTANKQTSVTPLPSQELLIAEGEALINTLPPASKKFYGRIARDEYYANKFKIFIASEARNSDKFVDLVAELNKTFDVPDAKLVLFDDFLGKADEAGLDIYEILDVLDGKVHGLTYDSGSIFVSPLNNRLEGIRTLMHEYGHHIEHTAFVNADDSVKQAIRMEYEAAIANNPNAAVNTILEASGRTPMNLNRTAQNVIAYRTSFDEWFAQQVAKWFESSARPASLVEKFFAGTAQMLSDLFNKVADFFGVDRIEDIVPINTRNFLENLYKPSVELSEAVRVPPSTELTAAQARYAAYRVAISSFSDVTKTAKNFAAQVALDATPEIEEVAIKAYTQAYNEAKATIDDMLSAYTANERALADADARLRKALTTPDRGNGAPLAQVQLLMERWKTAVDAGRLEDADAIRRQIADIQAESGFNSTSTNVFKDC